MPTLVTSTIGPTGTYNSFLTWMSAAPASLVTADQIWRGELQAGFVSTAGWNTGTKTTDATRYFELTTVAGASFRDHANAQTNPLRFDNTKGAGIETSAVGITANNDYSRISNLQIRATGANYIIDALVAADNMVYEYCIFEGACSGAAQIARCSSIYRNCIFICRDPAKGRMIASFGPAKYYNCTFVTPQDITASTYALIKATGTITATNCAFFGSTLVDDVSGSGCTYTTCKSSAGSLPSGITSAAYSSAQFASIIDTAFDPKPVVGSALVDAGTIDTSNAHHDIVGTARPQGSAYDVGAWELVGGAVAAKRSLMTMGVG